MQPRSRPDPLNDHSSVATLVLALRAPGVLPLTITGVQGTIFNGTSLQAGSNITITWTSVSTDPSAVFLVAFASLVPPDLADNVPTERGNITVELGVGLETGQYNLEFQFFRAPVAQFGINISSLITSSGFPQTGSSPLTTRQSTFTAPSDLRALTGLRSGIPSHHGSAGAISAGVVGGVVAVFLAFLGLRYFFWRSRRREAPTRPEQDRSRLNITKESPFFPAPISAALAGKCLNSHFFTLPQRHREQTTTNFGPGRKTRWLQGRRPPLRGHRAGTTVNLARGITERPQARPRLSLVKPLRPLLYLPTELKPAPSPSADAKQRIVLRRDPPAPTPASQPESGPSREELEDEVRRLREQVSSLSPPSYSEPE
ncbi:hypothetical protein K438DRAFT_1772711 [Mycena galopus ATCC 62051]|nr:hypothetical protein K438DRAFT_1772711 [Mycena galopus ATCC 62051]